MLCKNKNKSINPLRMTIINIYIYIYTPCQSPKIHEVKFNRIEEKINNSK